METRWVPPAFLWYKINTDAAVFSQAGTVGIGVVIWDHLGLVVVALSKKLPFPLGPLEAEAKAMDEAAFFAVDIGIRDALFESDSQAVYLTLTGTTPTHASIANIIASNHHKMHEFRTFNFSHVKRQGNRPAHLLASFAKGVDSYVTWLEETASFIESSTLHDAMYLSSPQ
ncbi:uncharacterized protein LOC142621828 [Castanea sativa]|uniref:uncharacterized protein LOC142621828 n=1 Tax=Castanea sativa TaxID=21020 RepID=UPI003F64B603